MSTENLEIVRRAYADPAPLSSGEYVASDAQFDFTALYPDQPILRGIEEMRAFRDHGPWGPSIQFEPERYFDVDDERVLVFRPRYRHGAGERCARGDAHRPRFTVRKGLILHVKVHRDRRDALRAVGLSA